jgi:cell division protein FtsA
VRKESRGLRRGYVVNVDEAVQSLREAVREAERQAKNRIRNVVLGIGGITLEAKTSEGQIAVARPDAEVTEHDITRVIEVSESNLGDLSNRKVLHTFPMWFKLDEQKVLGRAEGLRGRKLEVKTLSIYCFSQHLNDLVHVAEQAGLIVEDIVASPLAASLPTLSANQKMAGCALINIGAQTTSLITFEEGLPISLQVFPIGSNDVTNDIALGLRVSIEEAEKMKLESGNLYNLKKKLDEIIEARLSDMFELVENHLKKIGRNGLLPAGAIIVGSGSNVDNIEKLAKETLHLPARIFDPGTNPQLKGQIKDTGAVVAYGLSLFGLGLNEEEAAGGRLLQTTGKSFIRWLRELLP